MTQKPKATSLSDKVLKTNASVYMFFSGALISVSVNLYTGVFSSDKAPTRWKQVLISTVLTAFSGSLWAILAWSLEDVQKLFAASRTRLTESIDAWELLVRHKRGRLMTLFCAATLCAVAGGAVVPLGIQLPDQGPIEQKEIATNAFDKVLSWTNDSGSHIKPNKAQ